MSTGWKIGKLKFKEGVSKPVYVSKKAKRNEEKE